MARHILAVRDLKDCEDALNSARKAERQSQSILSRAQAAENHQAAAVAREALTRAQAAITQAQTRCNAADRNERTLARLLKNIAQGPEPTALPTDVIGHAYLLSHGRKIPLAQATRIQPGDEIKVGPNSEATLVLSDGSKLWLDENTDFRVQQSPTRGQVVGQELLDELFGGSIHIVHDPRIDAIMGVQGSTEGTRFKAVYAVAAVRGTEFDLTLDRKHIAHLVPYSGSITLSATPHSPVGSRMAHWWFSPAPAFLKPASVPARIAAVRGAVFVQPIHGKRRAARPGENLPSGTSVMVAKGAVAQLDLPRGDRIALDQGSTLKLGTAPHTGAALALLRRGRMHVWTSRSSDSTRLLTPNAVVAPSTGEFEITVRADHTADFVAVRGAIDITAVSDRLDKSKLHRWWAR